MLIIIFAFIILAIKYITNESGIEGLVAVKPFYNPSTYSLSALFSGTALVALTYVGFDGITTLAEDVKNPKKNILLAIIIVCLFTGIFSSIQMYLAQQSAQTIWLENGANPNIPFYQRIPAQHIETAFMTVCAQVGGVLLFNAMTLTMFVACLGSGMAGQLGAAKLLYGMGKDNVLPKRFFGHLDKKSNSPVLNLLLIGILTFGGSLLLDYQKTAELINFAALIAFMGVNLAAIRQLYFRSPKAERKILPDFIVPAMGFLFCLWIWTNLPGAPKIVGGIWLFAGIIYLAFSTRGFRKQPVMLDFTEG
jgi:amino acid transporter